PPTKKLFNPFHVPALDLDGTERDAEAIVLRRYISNGLNTTSGHGRSGGEEDDNFPPAEELLLGAGKAQKWQRTGSRDRHMTGGSEGNLEYTAKNDRNSAAGPRSSEDEHKEKVVVVGDSLAEDRDTQDAQREAGGSIGVHTSDDLTADRGNEEGEAVGPDKSTVTRDTDDNGTDSDGFTALRNKPTPKFRSPDRGSGSGWEPAVAQHSVDVYGGLRGWKNKADTPNTFSPNRSTLLSTPGKQTRGSKGGNREGLAPDPSTVGHKKNSWHGQEAEADNKEEDKEKHSGNGDKKNTSSLGSTKKRRPSAVEGKSGLQRRVKRRRCSSPNRDEAVRSQDNIFAVQDQDLDIQADGTSPDSKSVKPEIHNATIPRGPASGTATSPPALEQAQGPGDAAQVEEPELEFIKILDMRETVSGTEYMIRWKNTWLPKSELGNARKLLRKFEAKNRARHGRKQGKPARTDKVW
ncbi:MAG: hypothetical protein Q9217_006269, partial [Psora testacea]